jgi:hypothetical protein
MGQRLDVLIAEPDELVDELAGAIHDALDGDTDRHVLAGLLLEGAVQAIAQIVSREAQTAARLAFIGLALARFGSTVAR